MPTLTRTPFAKYARSLAQPCVKQKMLLQRKPKTHVKLRGIGYFLPTAKTPDGKSNKSKSGYNGPEVRWIFDDTSRGKREILIRKNVDA